MGTRTKIISAVASGSPATSGPPPREVQEGGEPSGQEEPEQRQRQAQGPEAPLPHRSQGDQGDREGRAAERRQPGSRGGAQEGGERGQRRERQQDEGERSSQGELLWETRAFYP